MKKFYLFFLAALLTVVSAAADTFTARLVIDHPERVSVQHNYNDVADLQADNTFEFVGASESDPYAQYSNSLSINTKSGDYFIKSVTDQNGVTISVYNGSECYISWSYLEPGSVFTVVTGSYAEARTASCTINVDNASGVSVRRGNSGSTLSLTNGANTVSFDPESEKEFSFSSSAYGRNLYSLKRNGVEQTAQYGVYYITDMADGDVIDVLFEFPDIDVPVTISVPEDAVQVIRSITADNDGTTTAVNTPFDVKLGTRITVELNTGGFILDGVKLNGSPMSVYGDSFNFLVSAETTVEVNAHPVGNINFVLNINEPEAITLYDNSSYNQRNVLDLVAGRNELQVSELSGCISFSVNSGYTLVSFTDANGGDYFYNTSSITVREGSEFTVNAEKLVLDRKVVVYVDDLSQAPYGYAFQDTNRNYYDLQNGYNFFEIAGSFNPFQFAAYGFDGIMDVIFNGENYAPVYPNSTSYEFTLDDGDVVKIFLNGEPAKVDVTVASDATAPFTVRTDHLMAVAEPSSFSVHKGSHVSIHPETKDAITVKQGDTPLTADAEGVFHLDVDAATALSVSDNFTSGIENVIAGEGLEGSDVFTLQGVCVLRNATAESLRSLPAGLYIAAGRKFIVR